MSVLLSSVYAVAEPIDPAASAETKALFNHLKRVSEERVLFGHQHTTCYGIGWNGDSDRSDVKTMTGSFPAVYGWDMGHTGTENMDRLIIEAFERGGINTISWHMENLSTGKSCKDVKSGSVANVLPGGKDHDRLLAELDRFAESWSPQWGGAGVWKLKMPPRARAAIEVAAVETTLTTLFTFVA